MQTLFILRIEIILQMRYNISTVKDRRKPKREVNRRGKLKAAGIDLKEILIMTTLQKRENLEKRMYREISKGNFEKADKIRKQLVDLDVISLKKRMA